MAAALESVFPRIGLKSFLQLTAEEKRSQLDEMARIVLGIRLYNRDSGKSGGGAGLPVVEEMLLERVHDLRDSLEAEAQEVSDACLQYQETIVYAHLREPAEVTAPMMARWKEELANQRQYLSYIQSLQEDVAVSMHKVNTERDKFLNDMAELSSLVSLAPSPCPLLSLAQPPPSCLVPCRRTTRMN